MREVVHSCSPVTGNDDYDDDDDDDRRCPLCPALPLAQRRWETSTTVVLSTTTIDTIQYHCPVNQSYIDGMSWTVLNPAVL